MTLSEDPHRVPLSQREHYFVEFARPYYTEHDFLSKFHNISSKDDGCCEKLSRKLEQIKTKVTWRSFFNWLLSALPVLTWLPQYNLKRDAVRDLLAGLTLGVIIIPQGMAYSMVAALPPVIGLYMSLAPVFVYAIFGTSRHISIGSFAIISLMVGEIIEEGIGPKIAAFQPTNTTSRADYELVLKMRYAVASSMVVGLAQFVMGLLRVGFVTIYLSDPLISGFTTGATLHILTSQVRHYFGIDIPQKERIGFFALFKTYYYLFAHIRHTNIAALLIGFISTVLLFLAKYLNEKYGKYVRGIPLPWELIIVAVATGMSYGWDFHEKFNVNVIGVVPKGLPPLTMPVVSDMQEIIVKSIVVAIVIFAINISLAKAFAKKNGYVINVNQELYAYGLANVLSSFFSCFPSAASLSRSLIQENLGSTQIASLWSAAVVILVLVVLAPLFTALPNAILAAIILVALKGALRQFGILPGLWRLSKIDFFVWVSSFLAVACLGVAYGLGLGLVLNILTTLVRSSWPSSTVLGHVPQTGVFKNKKKFAARDIPGVQIFQYHGPLFYANVEHFQEAIYAKTVDPRNCVVVELTTAKNIDESKDSPPMFDINPIDPVNLDQCGSESQADGYFDSDRMQMQCPSVFARDRRYTKVMHSLIIDCSQVSFIDSMAIAAFTAVVSEYKKHGVVVFLACCSDGVQAMLELGGFIETFGNNKLYVTIKDAILAAVSVKRTHGISPPLSEDASDEEAELDRSQVYNRTCSLVIDADVPLTPTRMFDLQEDNAALLLNIEQQNEDSDHAVAPPTA